MKRYSPRQFGFAAMIAATMVFTWMYASNGAVWMSAAYARVIAASTPNFISASSTMTVVPAVDGTGNRLAPVTVVLTAYNNWDAGYEMSMWYRVTDLSTSAITTTGTVSVSATFTLDVAEGETRTFRVERAAWATGHGLAEDTQTVDVTVYRPLPEPAGPAVATTMTVTPPADGTGLHASPALLTLSVAGLWDPAYPVEMSYQVIDLSTLMPVAQGITSTEVTTALVSPLGVTTTFQVIRVASVTTPWGVRGEATSVVDVQVTHPEPASPAVATNLIVTPAADPAGKHLSPAVADLSVTSLWDPSYPATATYRAVDIADGTVVAEGSTSTETTFALTAPPGVTRTFLVERSAFVYTPIGVRTEATSTANVSVYGAQLVTTLGRPTVPATARHAVKVKVRGTIGPARTVGATRLVKLAFYRWEKPRGKHVNTWVKKKTAWAKLGTTTSYTGAALLSKGTWTVIATAAKQIAYKAGTSPRSRKITVR